MWVAEQGMMIMTAAKRAPKRISAIRYCDPAPRSSRSQAGALAGVAMVTALGLAIAVLAVTIGAAQAMQ
jgi:hypothetical protein